MGEVSLIQAALQILREQGFGHILTISSVGSVLSFRTGGTYLATKFSIKALSKALAGEVAPFGDQGHDHRARLLCDDLRRLQPGSRAVAPMEIYDPVRNAIRSSFNPGDVGDPAATCDVIMKIVDEAEPPLRLVLGSKTIPKFRTAYERRLKKLGRMVRPVERCSVGLKGRPTERACSFRGQAAV